MLQERGEQYIRAIQLYVAKWKSYPPSMDLLEKTNNAGICASDTRIR